jgi:tetratricopeptide (TPR) repeat protein
LLSAAPHYVHSALVPAANLEIPPKAERDYVAACNAVHNQKWADAEKGLRKAVQQYPKYAAAWITLGQIMQARQQPDQARLACTQAALVDPAYLPAQLCLADIAAHEQAWEQVLKFSQRALELNSATDPHAYFYAASAYLKLNRIAEAEQGALKAADMAKQNLEPRVQFLLAQIYELKGDTVHELEQLREYAQFASDPQDAAMVQKHVADLETKIPR